MLSNAKCPPGEKIHAKIYIVSKRGAGKPAPRFLEVPDIIAGGETAGNPISGEGEKVNKRSGLTAKQERFCQEYIIDYNGTRAAIRAGYSEDSARFHASRMLSRDNIRARVRQLQAEQVKRLAVSQDYVVQQLVSVYQKCSEPEPVEEWDGEAHEYLATGKYTFDSKGANKALELLGKHLGMYQDKVSVDVQTPKFEGEQDIE